MKMYRYILKSVAFCALVLFVETNLNAQGVFSAPCHYDGLHGKIFSAPVCNSAPWVLVFEDNFDGDALDTRKWDIWGAGVPNGHDFQNVKAWHSSDNVEVSNGTIKITAKKHNPPLVRDFYSTAINPHGMQTASFDYSTGWIETHKKYGYGKYEIRCKVPIGPGFIPAFWTYGDGGKGWNEIDVFEFFLKPNVLPTVVHPTNPKTNSHHDYDSDGNSENCSRGHANGTDYSQAFHTFTMIWDPFKIQWFIDGVLIRQNSRFLNVLNQKTDCHNFQAGNPYLVYVDESFPEDQFQQIIANLAVYAGGNAPNSLTPFPATFEIDYIRHYKRASCAAKTITNNGGLNLSTENYNLVIGSDVTMLSNVDVPSGQQLDAIATNQVKLQPGFKVSSGADFIAKINPGACGPFSRKKDQSLVEIDNEEEVNTDIAVYPNPAQDELNISFGANSSTSYTVELTDPSGRLLRQLEQVTQEQLRLDIGEFADGIYILRIIDNTTEAISTHKVIKQ